MFTKYLDFLAPVAGGSLIDPRELLQRVGAQELMPPVTANQRTHYLLPGNSFFVPRIKELREVLAACMTQAAGTALVTNLKILFRPSLVVSYGRVMQPGFQRACMMDLDYTQLDGDREEIEDTEEFVRGLYDVLAELAENLTPLTEAVVLGGTYPDKPVSYHVFFPDFCLAEPFPAFVVDAVNAYLQPFHLSLDYSVAGIKWLYSDKYLRDQSIWRNHGMKVLGVWGPSDESCTWHDLVRMVDPVADELEERLVIEWAHVPQGRQALVAAQAPRLTELPPDPDVRVAWDYYQLQFSPGARVAAILVLNGGYCISTTETHNLVCHHTGNNHRIIVKAGSITIKCHGTNNSKTFQLTVQQATHYLSTVQQAPEYNAEQRDWTALVEFLNTNTVGVDTPITVDDFYRQGRDPPLYALYSRDLGDASLLSHATFTALANEVECTDETLVRYVNLAVGFVMSAGTFIVRYTDGTVEVGFSEKTIRTMLAVFQWIKPGAKKESNFYDTWHISPARSVRQDVRVCMEDTPPVSNYFSIYMRPRLTPAIAHRLFEQMEDAEAKYNVVTLWWKIFMRTLTGGGGDNPLFCEWLQLWVAEVIFGKCLPGLYTQLYEPDGGVGKSRLGAIIRAILGENLCREVKDVTRFLQDRWCTGRIGKRFFFIDDANDSEAKSQPAFNGLITNEYFDVEFKGGRQGKPFRSTASVLVATNECKLIGTTRKDRRCGFFVARPYYSPECEEFSELAREHFGTTHQSFLGFCFDNLQGDTPSDYLVALAVHLASVRSDYGESDAVLAWLRARVERGDLRTEEKDSLAEQLFGDIGTWIIDSLLSDGSGHLFHLETRWAGNDRDDVFTHPDWPHTQHVATPEGEEPLPHCNHLTDTKGRYTFIPSDTLYRAFKVAGYRMSKTAFIKGFVDAFNGLSRIWNPAEAGRVYAEHEKKSGITKARVDYNELEQTYFFTPRQSTAARQRGIRLDYEAVDMKLAENN